MPQIQPYNRQLAVNYAYRFALMRDPNFFDFTEFGGNCTAFVSQCLYYANKVMNTTPIFGWYYFSSFNRSPSWSGVEFFYNFLTTNSKQGPFATTCQIDKVEIGDIVQLKFEEFEEFTHTLIITKVSPNKPLTIKDIYVSTNTYDALNKNLSYFNFDKIRFLKILGVYIN